MSWVVLDTNGLVSALLFDAGSLSWLWQTWLGGRIRPFLAEVTTRALLRVQAYPKFALTATILKGLLAERLPRRETRTGTLELCPQHLRDHPLLLNPAAFRASLPPIG